MKYINVAIDGPAGAGKSTAAKKAAKELGFIYVDTGAIYRTAALYVIRAGKDPKNAEEVIPLLDEINVTLKINDGVQHIFLNGEDVSSLIRTPEISMGASAVSAIGKVREHFLMIQRDIASKNNVIMDGRDIGTAVLVNADVKIYLTASDEVRAKRRFDELAAKGEKCSYEDVLNDIKARDYADIHREINPLRQAPDAVLLDSSDMSETEVTEKIIEIIRGA